MNVTLFKKRIVVNATKLRSPDEIILDLNPVTVVREKSGRLETQTQDTQAVGRPYEARGRAGRESQRVHGLPTITRT